MKEEEALGQMVYPLMPRKGKPLKGVIQIWVTRACNLACVNCTQGSNLVGNSGRITLEQFEQACISLKDYFGVVGVFGGNPAVHPRFDLLCEILRKHIPFERRGLWCNNLMGKGEHARKTFNPAVSNLNVHLDQKAYDEFRRDWPECKPFGLTQDSRHSPPYVALQDVIENKEERWGLIADCDINKHWSAMICVVSEQLRAYFCEIAGAQAILHQGDPDWPDLGIDVTPDWWKLDPNFFANQVRFHCHRCGVPLRSFGPLAQDPEGISQTSETHRSIYTPKGDKGIHIITQREQIQEQAFPRMTNYLQNANQGAKNG